MKIIQLLPELKVGGVERGTVDLSEHIIKLGHNSAVISAGGQLVNILNDHGAKHYELPIGKKNMDIGFELRTTNKKGEGIFSTKQFQANELSPYLMYELFDLLATKNRHFSGVDEIAIMMKPDDFSCPFDCHYCPNQKDMPRSYVKEEPAVRRAPPARRATAATSAASDCTCERPWWWRRGRRRAATEHSQHAGPG